MPTNWKVLMIVITLSLVASVVIGSYRLITTPVELFGANFEGLSKTEFPRERP
jgi:Na+-transporting NADH:ubiquinone oxidoreductase subunit NqrC